MTVIHAGTLVRFTATLRDADAQLVDPTTVEGWLRYVGDAAETPLVLARQSLGVYSGTYTVPKAGRLMWGVRCTGPDIAASTDLRVAP
jgi:hypothetical protein